MKCLKTENKSRKQKIIEGQTMSNIHGILKQWWIQSIILGRGFLTFLKMLSFLCSCSQKLFKIPHWREGRIQTFFKSMICSHVQKFVGHVIFQFIFHFRGGGFSFSPSGSATVLNEKAILL